MHMDSWWTETDSAILDCLRHGEAMSPRELGSRIGVSEGEAIAFVCMLAREGKVRIRLVEAASEAPESPAGACLTAAWSSS
jgi:hypothetical protein